MQRRDRIFGKLVGAMLALAPAIILAQAAWAQPPTTLLSFNGTNGKKPDGTLIQATNGDFYGTTALGGANNSCYQGGCGTVFKITPSGTPTTLHSFDGADGEDPYAGLVEASNGDFYGTTPNGGNFGGANCALYGCGTVFKITPSGTLTTLHGFCSQASCPDGEDPVAGLIQAANGDLYGTTYLGGANSAGTIFKITPNGALTTLYSFCSQSGCKDGAGPQAALVQGTDGDLYGTTQGDGLYGSVFKITPSGTLTTLYSFCPSPQTGCTDGYAPFAGLVQATNGDFYGTTELGGTKNFGTVFKITPAGALTTLYSFADGADGGNPFAGLVLATDGNFYGTTFSGAGGGTIFKITPSGALTTLSSALASPYGGLVQATNGDFYGTTTEGGAGYGTVFSLSVGLGPFVKTLPTSGKVGAAVRILGTDLTGAISVTFDGTAAVFTVVRPSEISTSVPTGATTGKVEVTTPSGVLSSNAAFRVKP
jgi:uncharacterized repeat protein (TIGR03803 family)